MVAEIQTFWQSQLGAAAVGAGAAIVASFVAEGLQRRRLAHATLLQYITTVRTIRDELAFYDEVLVEALKQTKDAAIAVQSHQQFALPSFDFHPAFLAQCRINLASVEECGVSRITGKCHYELQHCSERLNQVRGLMPLILKLGFFDRKNEVYTVWAAMDGFAKLLGTTIDLFEDAKSAMEVEIRSKQALADKLPFTHSFIPFV